MSYCGTQAGMCGHRADCKDTHCEGHPSLYQTDGGHVYRDGLVWPMQPGEGMEQDTPIYTAESVAEAISLPPGVKYLVVVSIAVCMAIACGWLDPLFPR